MTHSPSWVGPLTAAAVFALTAVAAVVAGWPGASVGLLVIATIALIRGSAVLAGSWASLTVIFVAGHIMYGFAGPAAALTGSSLPAVFGQPYRVDPFLVAFGLATFGFALGLAFAGAVIDPSRRPATPPVRWSGGPAVGILVVALGSAFELINFVRAGGLPVLLQGKAVYQSAVSQLVLTLPSSPVIALGLILSTLSLWSPERPKRGNMLMAILLPVALLPALVIALGLGSRSSLLEWALAGVMGMSYRRPITRLSGRLVAIGLVGYVLSGILYANRALIRVAIATGGWNVVWREARTPERLMVALNPAQNEFGAAFGNFSEQARRGRGQLRLGSTYLKALAVPIPRFLYPGIKPKQLGYEFRDEFFPSLAAQGAIAGTAYSSLLEAEVNFGNAGPPIVYAIVATILVALEYLRRRTRQLGFHLVYLLLVPSAVAFHRSDGLTIGTIVTMVQLAAVASVPWLAWRWLRWAFGQSGTGYPAAATSIKPG